jgi:exosome complex component RRP40
LPFLGTRFPCEAAVGMNGRVWVTAKEIKHTIALIRSIEAADPDGGGLPEQGVKKFLDTLDI